MKKYHGEQLNNISFPMGGMGAGTICLTGWGSLHSVAIRHHPDKFFSPSMFSAVTVLGSKPVSKLLEAPVPKVHYYTNVPEAGRGFFVTPRGKTFGLPRFTKGVFSARFPFASLMLTDPEFPLKVKLTAWSPFIPGKANASSLPFAAMEYSFFNTGKKPLEIVYSFNAFQFLSGGTPKATENGFVLPDTENGSTGFCACADGAFCDCAWYRSNWWFDALTMQWNRITAGLKATDPYSDPEKGPSPGASLAVPFYIAPGEKKTICLRLCWYIPLSSLRLGAEEKEFTEKERLALPKYRPWYADRFSGIDEAAAVWEKEYAFLRKETDSFSKALASSKIPPELTEAVSANLSVLKSPTVLRQTDGRLWCWEGCNDTEGSCYGSCTHVWNYAQAIAHLFPDLEREFRETEFLENQDPKTGHQEFRTSLPIRKSGHTFYAAADGQLGGIIKTYREWRISGDTEWLRGLWKQIKDSLEYCIREWDPDREGRLHLPHHNTYDIEFCGCDSLTMSFYVSALYAAACIADALGENGADYTQLFRQARRVMEKELYNGEYFCQKPEPRQEQEHAFHPLCWAPAETLPSEVLNYMADPIPPYQYGSGCLSDEVLGIWLGELAGLKNLVDEDKLCSALDSVFKYNFHENYIGHANPQRAGYAAADEPGLLLCSWPRGGKPSLPFVYSDEVWTGVEYQVASHLLMKGRTKAGLELVRAARSRYDGRYRNPFSEYECGDWYARSLASYALLEAYTGVRYDAVTQTLYASSRNSRDYSVFFAAGSVYGIVTLRDSKLSFKAIRGHLPVAHYVVEP